MLLINKAFNSVQFADKNSILVDFHDEEVIKILLTEISKLGNVYLPEYTSNQLQKIKPLSKTLTAWKNDVNPYINYAVGKYGEYPNRRRNNLLHRLDSKNMKASLITATDKENLEICFAIDIDSAKQAKGKGIFYRSDVKKFYQLLSKYNPENIQINLMYFENKPVSYLIGFLVKGTYQASQKAFLTGYEYFNPGKLLMIKVIDYYSINGNPIIELGRGYDRFKRDFSKDYHELYNLFISENKFIRLYISSVSKLRMRLYELMYRNVKIYRSYTRLRDYINYKT